MTDNKIIVDDMDYRNIFTDIAEKLFARELIDDNEKIKLINIINKDESFLKKVS